MIARSFEVPAIEIPFDFRKPPAGPKQKRVAEWLTEVCRVAPKLWTGHLACPTELRLLRIESCLPAEIQRSLAESALGFVLETAGNLEAPVFLMVERPTLLALLEALFGELPALLPADRDFTTAEAALLDYLLDLLLQPFRTPTSGTEPVPLSVKTFGLARALCPLSPTEPAPCATLYLVLPCGAQPVLLFFPPNGSASPSAAPPARPAASLFDRTQVEAALGDATLDFSVDLGQARLTLSQLAALKVGDVVVLDQRIADPLRARVAGADKFDVWPGAVGRHQAVRIHGNASTKAP